MGSHILITGTPGIGKTTLIRKLANRLAAQRPAGFYTEEIREHGVRKGFKLVTLDGREALLAHVDHRGPDRVGRYGVDVAGFDRILAALNLRNVPTQFIIIDEIGRMECLSSKFVTEVTALMDSPKTVIATVALRGQGFIRQVKQRADCRLVTVTTQNRESLADALMPELNEVKARGSARDTNRRQPAGSDLFDQGTEDRVGLGQMPTGRHMVVLHGPAESPLSPSIRLQQSHESEVMNDEWENRVLQLSIHRSALSTFL